MLLPWNKACREMLNDLCFWHAVVPGSCFLQVMGVDLIPSAFVWASERLEQASLSCWASHVTAAKSSETCCVSTTYSLGILTELQVKIVLLPLKDQCYPEYAKCLIPTDECTMSLENNYNHTACERWGLGEQLGCNLQSTTLLNIAMSFGKEYHSPLFVFFLNYLKLENWALL